VSGVVGGRQVRKSLFDALLGASRAIWSSRVPEQALGEIASHLGRAVAARDVVIALVNDDGRALEARGTFSHRGGAATGVSNALPMGWTGLDLTALNPRSPVLLGDDPRALAAPRRGRSRRPALVFPIAGRERVHGALFVSGALDGPPVGAAEARLCQSVAEQLAAAFDGALERARAQQRVAEAAGQARLVEMVVEDRGVEAITAALADLLDNPVMLSDRAFHLLSVSPNQDHVDRMRLDCMSEGGIPRQALDDPEVRLQFRRVAQHRGPVVLANFPEHGWVQRRIQAPVMTCDEVLGWLSVAEAERPFRPTDYALLQKAAVAFGLELGKRQVALDAEHRLRADLLGELLAGPPLDIASVTARASYLGIDLRRPWDLMVVEVDEQTAPCTTGESYDRSAMTRRTLQAIRSALRQRRPEAVLVWHGDGIVVLLPSGHDRCLAVQAVADLISQEIDRVSLDGSVSIGIGGRCERVVDFARAYTRARRALQAAQTLRRSDVTVSLDDLGVYGLLFRRDDPDELNCFATRMLGPLLEHDARHGDALLDTLRVYLDENGNHRRTAARLFIHVNTLGGRLQRIAAVTKLDLGSSATRFNLRLALSVHQMSGSQPGGRSTPDLDPTAVPTRGAPRRA